MPAPPAAPGLGDRPALRPPLALGLAVLLGAGVTGIEFAGARQLAPAFGQSLHVWTAVLALLLLGLAGGNALAPRLSARPRLAGPLVLLGGLWSAAAALAGPALCAALTPTGLPGGDGLPLALGGSLAATALLHLPPLVALGAASPLLVALSDPSGRGTGAGRVQAAGTLGALAGCWFTPLVLLQTLGTRGTLLLTAAALASAGLALAAAVRGGGAGAPPARTSSAAPGAGGGVAPLLLLAALAGAAVLALELLAVRLFSPWCGQSNRIWANVIGVALLALAVGGWLGARLARAGAGLASVALLLALSAPVAAATALLGPTLAEALVPRGIDALRVLPVAFGASLALAAVFLALPCVLLGAVPAVLVPALAARVGLPRAAGLVASAGTLGSVLATFGTPLLLVPQLGSPRALLLVGAALCGGALLARPRARRTGAGAALAVAALAAGVVALPRGPVRSHPGQLEERESAYQSVRVVRERVQALSPEPPPAWGGRAVEVEALFLRHDEDAETYQSLRLLGAGTQALTGGRYYEQLALGPRLLPWAPGRPLSVLIVGYAGGAVHRVLQATLPPGRALHVVGVEIDPLVVEMARRHLGLGELEDGRLRLVTGEDARTVVNALPAAERFDLVLVDAYARTNYIPFQLATREFFAAVARHLAPGGWIGVNVLGTGLTGRVCRAVASTLEAAVGPTYLHPNVWFSGNVILWSSPDPQARPRLHLGGPEDRLHPLLEVSAYALERLAVRHRPERDGGVVLTDDCSPSDRLADEELGL